MYDTAYEAPDFSPSQRAVQNISPLGQVSLNSLTNPARPGQWVALWGTGLGAAPGDEALQPIPGHLARPGLQVFAGTVAVATAPSHCRLALQFIRSHPRHPSL